MHNTARRTDSARAPEAAEYTFTRSTWVHAAPEALFELISDVSMISTWSPSAYDVAYDDGDGPWPGARFQGRNRRDGREWSSRPAGPTDLMRQDT